MAEAGFQPDMKSTKYTIMDFFARTGHPQAYQFLAKCYQRTSWINDPHGKFYLDFIQEYIDTGGPISEMIQEYYSSKANTGLRISDIITPEGQLTHNPEILEDLYVLILGKGLGKPFNEIKPVFDTYGPLSQFIPEPEDYDEDTREIKEQAKKQYGNDVFSRYEPFNPDHTSLIQNEQTEWLPNEDYHAGKQGSSEGREQREDEEVDSREKGRGREWEEEMEVEGESQSEAVGGRVKQEPRELTREKINEMDEESLEKATRQLEKLKKEHPELYQRLYKFYRADVYREPIDDEEVLDLMNKDPLLTVFGQLHGLEQFSEENVPDGDEFPVQAMRFWNNTLGPSVESKMMTDRYFEIQRAKRDKRGLKRNW